MKNKKLLIIMISACFLLTGCTQYAKDKDNKLIEDKTTGLKIVENTLCRPTDKATLKLYEDNNIDISNLKECKDFKVFESGYEGIWNTLFVKTLAWVILKIGSLFGSYGVAIIVVTMLIRLIMYPLTQKTANQSEYMKEAQKDIEKIEKKYENKTTKEDTFAKSQELSLVYKKHNINPLSGCLFALIQIPLFFAFYEALNRLPVIFEGKFLGINMGMSPSIGLQNGNYFYIIVVVLVILTTALSFKFNANMTTDNNKGQMKTMTYMSIAMISITSFTISSAIAVYWITNSTFTIIQNLLVKRRKKNEIIR